jgi:hypothetical protein
MILFCKTTKEFGKMLEEAKKVISLLSQADEADKLGKSGTVPTHNQILDSKETPEWIKFALDTKFDLEESDIEGMDVTSPIFLVLKGVNKMM